MKKKIIAAALMIVATQGIHGEHFILTSPLLPLIDGKSYAIDGEVFGLLLQVRRKIRILLFGVRNDNGTYVGRYDFDGEKKSIVELSMIETQLEATYYTQIDQMERDKDRYTSNEWAIEMRQIEQTYKKGKDELQQVLLVAENDFIKNTASYNQGVTGFKSQLIGLIRESCEFHGNPDSFLLTWEENDVDDEGEMLKEELNTIKKFQAFCQDLVNFLEDMARSCTQAKQLFIEMIKKSKEKKG